MADRGAANERQIGVAAPAVSPRSPNEQGRGSTDWAITIALALGTLAVYAQVIGHDFIALDDPLYIRDNTMVKRGLTLEGLRWAFTTLHAGNWHPLTWISHMVDCQMFGLRAGGHLLVNTLIHIANTALVFHLLARMTGARWRSAMVAALFALHPLHVESVAWAAERKDTLSTFCGLLSLLAYVRYVAAPTVGRYAATAALLALGLMAKPMLVTWPLVMLLMDYWPLRRLSDVGKSRQINAWARLVREKAPLFAIVAVSVLITFMAQTQSGAVRSLVDAPAALRASNVIVSYAKYLLLTFWPHNLTVLYPFGPPPLGSLQTIGALLLLVAVSSFCFSQRKERPYLIVGWLWFVGTLVPVIGLVQVGAQGMADRYHYVPSIGLFTGLVFGGAAAMKLCRFPRWLPIAVSGAIVLTAATLTARQVQLWRDSATLFEHTLRFTPPNELIEYNYGSVLAQSGKYDKAVTHLERAIAIRPDFHNALVNLAITRLRQNRLEEAIPLLQRAIAAQPDSPKAHAQLGLAYAHLNQNEAAASALQRAVELGPGDADARATLGLVYLRLQRLPEAAEHLQAAIRLAPNNAEAHNNLGIVLLATGRARESIPEFETALRLNPRLEVARENIQRAQAQLNTRGE
jgi:tetratricopeptide (TPR) repeat protein